MRTVAILLVKSFDSAKQRLGERLSPADRRALAEAMFADVLLALRRTDALESIVVVSGDRTAQLIAGRHGAFIVDDLDRGHNDAARRGIRRALEGGADRALLVPGDCPMLDSGELDALLTREFEIPSAVIVPDRHGTGTNALLLTPPGSLDPAFGPDSRQRHAVAAASRGTAPSVVEIPSLGLDVDTPEDLEALEASLAATHGRAAHTRGMLTQLTRSRSR
jgi:2-phospho-L-lactate guanylyltransferase